ncbi:MAG TPA: YegS/Rv2252/BmrU family lipid kinase [Candidatus Acidoferrales bacterium]|nr:YegS/Rv2252/BmrU family lipid kinase [Candidatus Acidoferrales bacterium]
MSRRLLVLFNPNAHSGNDPDAAPAFEAKLRAAGFDVVMKRLDEQGGVDAAAKGFGDGCDAFVIGGGDGTMGSALPAILKAGVPMGVWPLGTANDFARSLGIENADDTVESLAAWNERRIDVADVNGHYFINNVTIGLPAEAAARLTHDLKARLGVFATVALVPTLWQHAKPFEVEIEADGRTEHRKIVAAMIGSGEYEGGFPVKYSGLADGKLHLGVCRAHSRAAIVPILFDVALKRAARSRRIDVFSAEHVVVRCVSKQQRIAADGDIVTQTPAEITLHPAALRVLAKARTS